MVREVADELYIKRVLMVLEDFLFFSLYSFSCIASSSMTLKDILILVFSIRTSSSVLQHPYHLRPTPTVTDIGKGQRLRKAGNARNHKVSAMKPGLAKIIEKVRIS